MDTEFFFLKNNGILNFLFKRITNKITRGDLFDIF